MEEKLIPEERKREYLEKIAEFKLMDDTYMVAFFNEQPELMQLVLRIILKNDTLTVKSAETQKPLKNLHGHSLTLDVYAEDEDGVKYDIEVQQLNSGANPRRARYHSSMIDSNILDVGDDFANLAKSYVIFIMSKDYWHKNKPLYTVHRRIDELDMELFDDGECIIYVNGEFIDDTPLGKLMHDFKCSRAGDMNYSILAERSRYFKETEGGNGTMCKIMQDLNEKYAKEAEKNTRIQIAENLINNGKLSDEEIVQASGCSIEEVKDLRKKSKMA